VRLRALDWKKHRRAMQNPVTENTDATAPLVPVDPGPTINNVVITNVNEAVNTILTNIIVTAKDIIVVSTYIINTALANTATYNYAAVANTVLTTNSVRVDATVANGVATNIVGTNVIATNAMTTNVITTKTARIQRRVITVTDCIKLTCNHRKDTIGFII
jgi:hypothetical protein